MNVTECNYLLHMYYLFQNQDHFNRTSICVYIIEVNLHPRAQVFYLHISFSFSYLTLILYFLHNHYLIFVSCFYLRLVNLLNNYK